MGGAVVGDGGAGDKDMRLGRLLQAGLKHFPGCAHGDEVGPLRRLQRYRAANQGERCARIERGLRQGVTHASRGVVGEIAHGVQRFPGRPGGYQDVLTGEESAGEALRRRAGDGCGLRHTTGPQVTAGLLSAIGVHDMHAARAQCCDIADGGRVAPHLLIHGRGQQFGGGCGQRHGAEQLVRAPRRQPRQAIGRGRRDEQQVGPTGELDMAHTALGLRVEEAVVHGVTGQSLERQRRNKLLRAARHQHAHFGPPLLQSAHEFGGLVGRDATTDGQQHAATV